MRVLTVSPKPLGRLVPHNRHRESTNSAASRALVDGLPCLQRTCTPGPWPPPKWARLTARAWPMHDAQMATKTISIVAA